MAYAQRNEKKKLTGRWVCDAQFDHPDGSTTRWHKAFDTKREAEGAEAYYRATGERPAHMVSAPTESFASIAEEFKKRNHAWLTTHDGRTNAQRLQFAIDHLGPLDIKAIRGRELLKYRDRVCASVGVVGKPPANRTVNYYLDAVGKVLQFALSIDALQGRPQMPRMANKGEERQALSWATEDAVCRRLDAHGYPDVSFVVRVLAATGMRSGELQSLRPEQIETPERIEHTGIKLSEEQTKTHAARWVPIIPQAAVKLRALIASGKLPDAAHVYKPFKATIGYLGENEKLTIHCLRHTTVTRLMDSGADGLQIAKIVGHLIPGVPKMTLRYFKPDREHLFEVAKKVQQRLGEIPETGAIVEFNRELKTA